MNCPEFAEWARETSAVVYHRGSTDPTKHGCSGVLLNNTRQDGAPLVLMARHCAQGRWPGQRIDNWMFYFGRKSPSCNAQVSRLTGPCTLGNQCLQGATIVAATPGARAPGESDFFLVRLDHRIPESFNVYYAGWAVDGYESESVVTMGFPQALPMVITTGEFGSGVERSCGMGNSMLRIPVDRGQLVIGQSGSPVFDDRHYVRGVIRTGAGCNHPTSSCAVDLQYNWTRGDHGYRLVDHLAEGDPSVRRLRGRAQ
ncbi:MAG: hypothetical protein R3284_10435 [Rubricoccaceae bacterium]|nr:hypothetical protein [Rubricoccaceae bacterium]